MIKYHFLHHVHHHVHQSLPAPTRHVGPAQLSALVRKLDMLQPSGSFKLRGIGVTVKEETQSSGEGVVWAQPTRDLWAMAPNVVRNGSFMMAWWVHSWMNDGWFMGDV